MERSFSAHPTSGRAAQRFVADVLAAWRIPVALAEDGLAATAELISNAMVHTSLGIAVRIEWSDGVLRVAVHDQSSKVPLRSMMRVATEIAAPPDHGLGRVEALTTRWGVDAEPDGKDVWFEIDTSAA